MSHDRGCWKCGEDPSTYATCASAACPKREVFRTTTRFKPHTLDIIDDRKSHCSGCHGLTVHHTCGQHPDAGPETRPTCVSCNREQPLWGNCFRPAIECPIRAAFAPDRPATQIISVNEPGYEIVLFFNTDGGAQAVISRPGGKEPIDFLIAPPLPGRRIVVARKGDMFDVSYKDARHERLS